ncbi:MAG: methylated-DNA-[protein]-cysteine S-methyltransferase [Rhodothermales bacterium]|jgi:methylated-DNA-[protein]-cysteine S-methyltransferase
MITLLDSPIGTIGIRAENDLVQQIYLPGNTEGLVSDSAPPGGKVGQMLEQLKRYFAGDALEFDLRVLAPCGTPFQQRVRQLCAEIPLAETRRYAELAESAGSPQGARAVGGVMSGNPYAIVIPCHRVLSTTGLGGYAGGLDAKRWLLAHEKGMRP